MIHNRGRLFAIKADQSDGRQGRVCVCGKVMHPSRRSARRHLKTFRGVKAYDGEVYRCKQSGAWHVGWPKWKRGLPLLESFRKALFMIAFEVEL